MTESDEEAPLTLLPVYRFEWNDGTVRETSDPDFTSAHRCIPDAVEALAAHGREDPDCEVILIAMGD